MAEHRNEMKPKRSIDERAPALASAGFREAISVSRECQFDCLAPSLLVHVDRIGALTNQRENSYRLHSRGGGCPRRAVTRLEEHTSELQSLMRTSYAVVC